jgi:SAM-dependent methyltransferase
VSDDARAVEVDTARYYDAEGDLRCNRPLDERRVAARATFLALLDPARRVLEIGSGPGRDAAAFMAAGHRYAAVDLSYGHAQRCHATGAPAAQASVRHLPFATGALDAVWTMSTLMHVPDVAIDAALGEIRRVLAPGGVLAAGVWGGADAVDWDERATGRRLFARRTDERWRSMLARVGEVERYETWTSPNDTDTYQYAIVRSGAA